MNSVIKTLNANLEVLNTQLVEADQQRDLKLAEQNAVEIDQDDHINSYEEMLDECEGEFMGMTASYILKECDPTAYRCGLNDYCDSMSVEDTQEWKDLEEEIEELDTEIADLEESIETIEEEIEELEEAEENKL